jgi:hypothetical protein
MEQRVIEGEWEEILRQAPELAGRRVRVTVLDDAEPPPRNEAMLSALQRSAERRKDMPTSGSTGETLKIIRAARGGEMWGYEQSEFERAEAYAVDSLCDVLAYLEGAEPAEAEKLLSQALTHSAPEKRRQVTRLLLQTADRVDFVEGLRQALEDVKAGKGRPAREFFEELRKELSIPEGAKRSDFTTVRLGNWISVKDRLPEQTGAFLVAGAGRFVTTADWYEGDGWRVSRDEMVLDSEITHWTALPEPPGRGRTFDEILAPCREEVKESGVTDEELDELFTRARRDYAREEER